MPVDQPFNIYREQLSSQRRGLALWDPDPVRGLFKVPGHVSIGDVGFLDNGTFVRMFNVTLPWDDPSNELLGKPEKYQRIKPSYFGNIHNSEIRQEEYHSHVSKVDNVRSNTHDEWVIVLSCTLTPLILLAFEVPWAKRMSVGLRVAVHFCLFLIGPAPRMLSAQIYSRTTSGIT